MTRCVMGERRVVWGLSLCCAGAKRVSGAFSLAPYEFRACRDYTLSLYIYIYMYVCMFVCMYVCLYVRMYVYSQVLNIFGLEA